MVLNNKSIVNNYLNNYKFIDLFSFKHNAYNSYTQNDAQEFIRLLIYDLSYEFNRVNMNNKYEYFKSDNNNKKYLNDNFEQFFKKREDSIIVDMFYSQIINKFICECDYVSYNIEKIFDIPVLIPNYELLNYELENLIISYFRDDKIEFNTICANSSKICYHLKNIKMSKLAKVLFISIQRFDNVNKTKNNKNIYNLFALKQINKKINK